MNPSKDILRFSLGRPASTWRAIFVVARPFATDAFHGRSISFLFFATPSSVLGIA